MALSARADGAVVDPESFLDRVIEINGEKFERLDPITDYRRDPGEARILYLCRREGTETTNGHRDQIADLITKVKVQVPPRPASDDPAEPLPGPSETTAAEWKALQVFTDANLDGVPHLIAKTCRSQPPNGHFPGGYTAFTIMTRMPGRDLMDLKFWSLDDDTKEQMRDAFIALLKNIWRKDIAPYDCALRNIIWCPQRQKCSIVDFEHFHPAKDPVNMNEKEEMQRWGIVSRPPPSHWAVEWGVIKQL